MPIEVRSGLSYPEYGAIEALSSHRLMQVARSPRHAQVFRERVDTEALRLGKLVHLAALEPLLFHDSIAISQKFDRRFKQGKVDAEAFAVANYGKEVIDQDEFERISAIQEALENHPAASRLLQLCKAREDTILWTDTSGVYCKARPDLYSKDRGICCDLKTIRHGHGAPDEFLRSALSPERNYHIQAEFYRRGLQTEFSCPTWIWIVVETEEPYAVSCVKCPSDVLEYARMQIEVWIDLYASCLKSGHWPAYPDVIIEPDCPKWVTERLYGG